MPTYSSITKLKTAYPDAIVIEDTPLTTWALVSADGQINGQVGRVYTLPISPVPPLLEQIANDIAVYLILTSRPFSSPPRPYAEPPQAAETWQSRYNAAIAMLKQIGEGDLVLVGADGSVPPGSAVYQASSTTMNYVPTFGEGPDQTFIVDRNKTADEMSRRA